MQSGQIYRHPCSLRLEEVIRTMADMGGQYPDVVDLLQKAERGKYLSCAVKVDALPQPRSVTDLAQGGRDPNFLTETGELRKARPEREAGGGQ